MKKSIITHTVGATCFALTTLIFAIIVVNQNKPATTPQIVALIFFTSLFWIEIFVLDSIKEKNP